jgi:hypothetical protein
MSYCYSIIEKLLTCPTLQVPIDLQLVRKVHGMMVEAYATCIGKKSPALNMFPR